MDSQSRFNAQWAEEIGINPAQALSLTPSFVQSLDTEAKNLFPTFSRLAMQFSEFAGLFATFLRLFLHARLLMAQNVILSCKLQIWEIGFLYCKVQIFFIRLAHGFPVGECWPRIKSLDRR